MEKRVLAIVFVLAFAAALAAIMLFNPSLSGLIALPQTQKASTVEQQAISPELSFQVVQPTELNASIVEATTETCPNYFFIAFDIQNTGSFTAERLFVKPSENLKVLDCLNCSAKEIKPKQKVTLKIKACKTTNENAFLEFSSLNSEAKRIEIK